MNAIITPIEYKDGGYDKRVYAGEILAWYHDSPIEYVKEKNGRWELHYVDSSDSSLVAYARKYETCIEIQEATDMEVIRAEIQERVNKIIGSADHGELLGMLQRLREFDTL